MTLENSVKVYIHIWFSIKKHLVNYEFSASGKYAELYLILSLKRAGKSTSSENVFFVINFPIIEEKKMYFVLYAYSHLSPPQF